MSYILKIKFIKRLQIHFLTWIQGVPIISSVYKEKKGYNKELIQYLFLIGIHILFIIAFRNEYNE